MAQIKASEHSTVESPWSQWVIAGSGKHHLTKPGETHTKCGRKIDWPWVRITRTEVLPPSASDPRAERRARMCKACSAA